MNLINAHLLVSWIWQTYNFCFCIFSILAVGRNQLDFVGNHWIHLGLYKTGIYGYGYIHGYPYKICGYGYGYGWEISYPRQPCTILAAARHKRAHPALTPAGEGWYSIYLPRRDERPSWPRCLHYAPVGNRTHDCLIESPTPKPLRHKDRE